VLLKIYWVKHFKLLPFLIIFKWDVSQKCVCSNTEVVNSV